VWWNGSHHTIVWKTVSLIGVNEYNRRYEVNVSDIDGKEYSASIAIIVPPNITLTPGDNVEAFGVFRFPKDTSEYAGEKTLWYRGIVAEFQSFQSSKEPPKEYSRIVRIQQKLDKQLKSLFPPSGYLILSGILLGQRTAMDTELKEHLKASWLMHIMVVSGGNIMMLILFISLFVRSLPLFVRISIITITIFGFTIIVGGDMPVWRAALMGTIGYTASLWWYRFPSLVLPLVVAVMLSIWSPLSLVYDIGLQLSFFSVICIIVWWHTLSHALSFLWPFFSEATALTIAATIWTFPITLFYFGTFSLIGPIANMLAAPVIPVLMYSGIFTLLASVFSPTLALWIGYIPWIGTSYLSHIITFFGSQKWSLVALDITAYRGIFLVLCIGILILCIIKTRFRK
jgi:competence protein ComEC